MGHKPSKGQIDESSRENSSFEAAKLTATARQLCDIVPELNKNQCETLLLSVSDRAPVLRNIELALSKHPGLLTGQEPNMTVPPQKLCHALKKSGIQWVVLPACAGCQRELIMVNKAPDGGRYCASRLKKYRQKPCARHANRTERSIIQWMGNRSAVLAGAKILDLSSNVPTASALDLW